MFSLKYIWFDMIYNLLNSIEKYQLNDSTKCSNTLYEEYYLHYGLFNTHKVNIICGMLLSYNKFHTIESTFYIQTCKRIKS